MKTYWGSGYIAPRILELGNNGNEWSASRPGRFTQRKELLVLIGQEAAWGPEPVWTRW